MSLVQDRLLGRNGPGGVVTQICDGSPCSPASEEQASLASLIWMCFTFIDSWRYSHSGRLRIVVNSICAGGCDRVVERQRHPFHYRKSRGKVVRSSLSGRD